MGFRIAMGDQGHDRAGSLDLDRHLSHKGGVFGLMSDRLGNRRGKRRKNELNFE